MLKFNGSEIAHVLFDGLDIDIVNINGVKVFEAVRKTEYDPVLMTRTVTPYGETATLSMDVQEGGHIDTANIVTSGSIPVSNISASGNKLSFKTASCNKGITGKIQVPVVECKDYFDYLIPINLDSCTHPSSKLTFHSGRSASCTSSGTSDYYTCSCDSANHTLNASGNEISTYIAPLGHSFTTETIYDKTRQLRSAATCTSYTSYWRECDRCTVHSTTQWFYDYSSTKLPHSYTNSGYSSYYCTSCGTSGSNLVPVLSPYQNKSTTVSGSGGSYSASSTGAWTAYGCKFNTTVGKVYKYAYSVTNISSQGLQLFIRNDSLSKIYHNTSQYKSGSISKTGSFTANTSQTCFHIDLNNTATAANASCNFSIIIYPATS